MHVTTCALELCVSACTLLIHEKIKVCVCVIMCEVYVYISVNDELFVGLCMRVWYLCVHISVVMYCC